MDGEGPIHVFVGNAFCCNRWNASVLRLCTAAQSKSYRSLEKQDQGVIQAVCYTHVCFSPKRGAGRQRLAAAREAVIKENSKAVKTNGDEIAKEPAPRSTKGGEDAVYQPTPRCRPLHAPLSITPCPAVYSLISRCRPPHAPLSTTARPAVCHPMPRCLPPHVPLSTFSCPAACHPTPRCLPPHAPLSTTPMPRCRPAASCSGAIWD